MPLSALLRARKKLTARALDRKLRKTKSTSNLPESLSLETTNTQHSQQSVTESTCSSKSNESDTGSSDQSSIDIVVDPPPLSPKRQTLENKSRSSSSTPRMEEDLAANMSSINIDDLDLLLSMETQARIEAQAERERAEATTRGAASLAPRPTRLKFELPVTPPRSRSPARHVYPRGRPSRSRSCDNYFTGGDRDRQKKKKWRNSRWSLVRESDEPEKESSKLDIGSKVRIVTRPLPTLGFVRYMGPVEFDEGDWVGVELESRVGNNDGSVNGKRYFHTDPHRGTFVKKYELVVA